jgi:hypothetical protein
MPSGNFYPKEKDARQNQVKDLNQYLMVINGSTIYDQSVTVSVQTDVNNIMTQRNSYFFWPKDFPSNRFLSFF